MAFLQCFENEIFQIQYHHHQFAVSSLRGMMDLAHILRNMTMSPLSHLLRDLSRQYLNVEENSIQRSVELLVRLWLTANVNSAAIAVGPTFPREIPLDWAHELSLESLIQSHYPKPQTDQNLSTRSKVDGRFTAAYLVDVCGMSLYWTNYLTDHLRIDPKQRVLTVYKHKSFLHNQLRATENCPIPKDVLSEALDTLNLLFPFGDLPTKQLLARENQRIFYGFGSCGRDRQQDLGCYVYWREELQDLVDSFRQPPRTWKQLATDRRNMMEWAMFWVTVMVGLLTFVSIPCNIIQAVYSVKGYRATAA